MKAFVEFGVPILLCLGCFFLIRTLLRAFGLPLRNWRTRPELVIPWRRLKKWQFVGVRGIVCYSVPMALLLFSLWYFERLSMLQDYGPYYHPRHPYIASGIALIMLIAGGIWVGLLGWENIWDRKYDLPTQFEQ